MSGNSVPQHTVDTWASLGSECLAVSRHTRAFNSDYAREAGTALPCAYLHGTSDSVWTGQSGDRIPVEARIFAPVHTGPGPPSLLYYGYRVFPRGKDAGI
jgi:hypothetical protein